MASRSRIAVAHWDTDAVVLRSTPYRESDVVVSLFTERLGKVSALARAARKSRKRFGGSLEPLHGLHVRLSERASAEMMTLEDATIVKARVNLLDDLDGMDAAGTLLRWVREAAPARVSEPALWREIVGGLDALDSRAAPTRVVLARSGLRMLGALGWALELDACVACGKPCPAGRTAQVNPRRGGIVCQQCGGGRVSLAPDLRSRLASTAEGRDEPLTADEANQVLGLVRDALRAHADLP